jgi:putative spermidine/putrescine transport system permease protein
VTLDLIRDRARPRARLHHDAVRGGLGLGGAGARGTRLEEAAATLGATRWSILLRVTLPQIKPGLFAAFFYAFIISFGDVPVAVFLVDQETMTLPVEIFQTLQFDFEPTVLAISTLVVLFSMLLIVAVQRLAGLNLVVPTNRR